MKIETKIYTVELTPSELSVLNDALSFAYNALFLRENPEKTSEEHHGFFTDAAERPAQRILDEDTLPTLRRLTHAVQNVAGGGQTW